MKLAPATMVGPDDYQAQDDMRTLTRAEEIKADAKRHAKAMAHGKQQMAALQNVVKPDADDVPGKKEAGEGTPAEEAEDAKMAKQALPKRGQRTATNMKNAGFRVTQRGPKANRSSVI